MKMRRKRTETAMTGTTADSAGLAARAWGRCRGWYGLARYNLRKAADHRKCRAEAERIIGSGPARDRDIPVLWCHVRDERLGDHPGWIKCWHDKCYGIRRYVLERETYEVPETGPFLTVAELLDMAGLDPDQQVGYLSGTHGGWTEWVDPADTAPWGIWLVTRNPAEIAEMRKAAPVPSPVNGSKPPPVPAPEVQPLPDPKRTPEPAIAEEMAGSASGNKRMRISVPSDLVARIDGLAEDAGTTRAEWARRRISTALSLGFRVPDDVDWGGDSDRFDLPLHLPYRHLRQIAGAAAVEGVPVHRWMHAVLAVAADGQLTSATG